MTACLSVGFVPRATSVCLYYKLPVAPFNTLFSYFWQAMVLPAAWLLATKAQHSAQHKAAHLPETPRSLHQPRGGPSQWGCWGNPRPRCCSRGSSGMGPPSNPNNTTRYAWQHKLGACGDSLCVESRLVLSVTLGTGNVQTLCRSLTLWMSCRVFAHDCSRTHATWAHLSHANCLIITYVGQDSGMPVCGDSWNRTHLPVVSCCDQSWDMVIIC